MSASDAVVELIRSCRGERPYSMENVEAENAVNISLALLVELAAANDRIDRLERLLAQQARMELPDLRETRFGANAASERQAAKEAMIARVLRVLIDPRTPVPRTTPGS